MILTNYLDDLITNVNFSRRDCSDIKSAILLTENKIATDNKCLDAHRTKLKEAEVNLENKLHELIKYVLGQTNKSKESESESEVKDEKALVQIGRED